MNVLGFLVAGYFTLLGISISAILLDELLWAVNGWINPREDAEVEAVITDIKLTLDADTFNVMSLITLYNLKENVTSLFSSIAILVGWEWYTETTQYIGVVKFLDSFEERIEGLDSRDTNAMYRFRDYQINDINKFNQDYPKTTKFLSHFGI